VTRKEVRGWRGKKKRRGVRKKAEGIMRDLGKKMDAWEGGR